VTGAVVTLARGRHVHLARQAAAVAALHPAPSAYVVVSLEPHAPHLVPDATVLHHPVADGAPLPLAAARNRGIAHAAAAGAELVVVLDVDCVPEPALLGTLQDGAAATRGEALLAGPVGRLAPLADAVRVVPEAARADARERAETQGGARPVPPPGTLLPEPRVERFWSLAFAVPPAVHARIGGFDEGYVGYGAEDTDYAFRARRAGVPFVWVGGAWSHHQHHRTQTPPVQHLQDIVRNATRFRAVWGRWPMEGWLRAFADAGLVDWDPDGSRLRLVRRSPGSGDGIAGRRPAMDPKDRDPPHPTPQEVRETAASEGLIATEEETDPDFTDDRDPSDVPPADVV
jgi:hypothetical protein